jgi:hypothetical protein
MIPITDVDADPTPDPSAYDKKKKKNNILKWDPKFTTLPTFAVPSIFRQLGLTLLFASYQDKLIYFKNCK